MRSRLRPARTAPHTSCFFKQQEIRLCAAAVAYQIHNRSPPSSAQRFDTALILPPPRWYCIRRRRADWRCDRTGGIRPCARYRFSIFSTMRCAMNRLPKVDAPPVICWVPGIVEQAVASGRMVVNDDICSLHTGAFPSGASGWQACGDILLRGNGTPPSAPVPLRIQPLPPAPC